MSNIEVNTKTGDRLARIILSLPLGFILVALNLPYLFFISFYLVVTGITGISLEYNLIDAFKHEKVSSAKEKAKELKSTVKSATKSKSLSH